jgi:VanZ family protein
MSILKFLNQYKKTIGFLVLIFVLCLSPSPNIGRGIGWTHNLEFDKWVHFGLYFALFLIWDLETKRLFLCANQFVILAVIIGIGIELLQKIMPFHRSAELADVFADVSGLLFGYFIVAQRLLKKSTKA